LPPAACCGVVHLPNVSRPRKLTAKAFRLVALEQSEIKLKSNYLDSLFSPCYFIDR
jgi:hypothetical protein